MKVIKIGAAWCPGCLVMKPRWKEIEEELPWLETEYYDYDSDKAVVEKYSVDDRLPVFIWLDKSDNEIIRMQGEVGKEEILKVIEDNKDR